MSTGIGKVKSAASLQYLLDHYPIKNIIFIGVAGAINPNLSVGDIILGKKAIQHDFCLDENGISKKKIDWIKSSPELIKLAIKAGRSINVSTSIISGSIITGDQAIKNSRGKKRLWKMYKADCVDMEGASIAMVCGFNNTPFIIIRSISDHSDENTSRDFSNSFSQVSSNAAILALAMLEKAS